MIKYTCKFCNSELFFDSKQKFGAHVSNCKLNPKRIVVIRKPLKFKIEVNCLKCKKIFDVVVTDKLIKSNNFKKYCSLKCSKSRIRTDEIKLQIHEKLKVVNSTKLLLKQNMYELNPSRCKCCNVNLDYTRRRRLYCSFKCRYTDLKELFSNSGKKSSALKIKRSKQEIELFNLLNDKFTNVKNNFIIADNWDADIVLLDAKVAVMWNGPWHYKEMGFNNHSLKQVQTRDNIKIKLFESLGWKVYVFEDRYYTPKLAFEEIAQALVSNDIS